MDDLETGDAQERARDEAKLASRAEYARQWRRAKRSKVSSDIAINLGQIDPLTFGPASGADEQPGSEPEGYFARKRKAKAGKEGLFSIATDGIAANVKAAPVDENSAKQIAESLLLIHNLAAAALWMPELTLDPNEGQLLGTSIAGVARHYKWGGLAEKTKDWMLLIGTASMIYLPRIRAARERVANSPAKTQNKRVPEKPINEPAVIVQ